MLDRGREDGRREIKELHSMCHLWWVIIKKVVLVVVELEGLGLK